MATLVLAADPQIPRSVASLLPDESLVAPAALDDADDSDSAMSLVIVADDLPGGAAAAVERVRRHLPDVPAVVVGVVGRAADVAAALRQGVCEYVPLADLARLPERVAEVREEARRRAADRAERAALRAEVAAWRETERRVRVALEAGGIGYWDWEIATGAVRYVVEGARAADDMVGPGRTIDHFLAELHPEDAPVVRATLISAIEDGAPYVVRFRSVRPDGSVRWSDSRGRVIFDDHGRPVRMVGIESNITDQVAAEEAMRQATEDLRESQIRVRLALDAARLGFWEWNLDTGEVGWTVALERGAAGVPRPLMTMEAFLGLVHPDDVAAVRESLQRAIASEGRFRSTFRLMGGDGSIQWAESHGQVIADAAGRPARMVGIETNVTEQHELRDALRAAAESARMQAAELEIIFQLARIGLVVWDASPGIRCLRHNAHAMTLFGTRVGGRDDMVGMTLAELVGPEAYASVEAIYRSVVATGEPFIAEDFEWQEDPDAPPRSYIWALAPLRDERGSVTRLLGTAAETTALKRVEEARRQLERRVLESQKLESLGLLAGGVAHDLNNLLNVVLGNLELLRIDPKPEQRERYLARIEGAAQHGADLMRQLLSVAGRGKARVEVVRLDGLVREMAELLHTSIPRAVDLHLNLPDADLQVRGDDAQLRQVIMNLLINAVEAIGGVPGRIVISAYRRIATPDFLSNAYVADGCEPGEYAALEVRDSGPGMDAATLARIFEPFYTTKPRGRGLGLAAVIGIVRAHGGALRVWSAPGAGAVFTVLIPPLPGSP